ncbi:MAG: DUF3575 domain-containing protein [Saprospiraceae bacterium]|nr:DUF3575 domain-containing protein [Saprospiraceae bacterium]MCF8250717.1 DUF3575 domain-containing protein [Saprospiraceae bacterium]MCF8279773.1 DUF3575 domain-containing protein [Bacteroidales bacterium]MCF8310521.1 DUF3575 domain-containing protein [Saprospiraceae bacterium]MCF8440847.1 DUF3575 domain-containing protein [Saprospiraceae bacterium]
MKTTNFIAFLAVCFFIGTASEIQAQVDLTTNPVNLLFGNINAGADIKIKENFSIEANAAYSKGDYWGLVDSRERTPVNLIGKYYFSPKHGADGFYVDGFTRFVNRNIQATYNGGDTNVPTTVNFSRTQVGLGFGLGFKVVAQKGFVFDIGTGIGRALYSHDKVNVSEQDYKVPELIRTMGYFKIGLGYRFGGNRE